MKINLFFFISQFNFGGAGNAIFNFLENLDKKKYNLHMIFLDNSDYKKLLPKHVKSYQLHTRSYLFKTFFSFFQIRKIILEKNLINKKKHFYIQHSLFECIINSIFEKN